MKKLLSTITSSRFVGLVLYFLGTLTLTVLNGLGLSFVFVDTKTFDGFMYTVWLLFLLFTIVGFFTYILASFGISIKNKPYSETKIFKITNCVCLVVSLFCFVVIIVELAILGQNAMAFWSQIKRDIAYTLVALLLGTLTSVLIELKCPTLKVCILGSVLLILVVVSLNGLFPISSFKITSDPAVFDNGTEYNIVFATTDTSIGYVEIIDNDSVVRIYDTDNGKKVDSVIHTIPVAYDTLQNCSYKVGAIRTIVQYSYGGRTGKELTSKTYTFRAPTGDIHALSVSDWHCDTKSALNAVQYVTDYDIVFFLGDGSAGVSSQEEIIKYYIDFAGEVSKGEIPILYSRGNHDTRGAEAENLPSYLGYDNLNYTVTIGSYTFIVLDSTEDKLDGHPEYGGYNDYETQRLNGTLWLENLADDGKTHIALSHISKIMLEEELSERCYQKLAELDTKLVISGHTHNVKYNYDKFAVPNYEDGGQKESINEYRCSEFLFTESGATITAINEKGETVLQENIVY